MSQRYRHLGQFRPDIEKLNGRVACVSVINEYVSVHMIVCGHFVMYCYCTVRRKQTEISLLKE